MRGDGEGEGERAGWIEEREEGLRRGRRKGGGLGMRKDSIKTQSYAFTKEEITFFKFIPSHSILPPP